MRGTLAVGMAVLAAALVSCGGIVGMPGSGDGGGGYVMPASSPYMWSQDLAGYEVGGWVRYKMEAAGNSTETCIKVVGKDGGNLWIQVGMSMAGMEYDHLLLVQPDRKVVKAYYSGKDDKEWKKCDIDETPGAAAGKTCPGCKKEHKEPTVKWSDERKSAGGKDLSCKKCDATAWDCQGKEMKMAAWYCKDVPKLYAMGTMGDQGGLVGTEVAGSKTWLVGLGTDAKPKHELPKN